MNIHEIIEKHKIVNTEIQELEFIKKRMVAIGENLLMQHEALIVFQPRFYLFFHQHRLSVIVEKFD